jgi:hypothetical protein
MHDPGLDPVVVQRCSASHRLVGPPLSAADDVGRLTGRGDLRRYRPLRVRSCLQWADQRAQTKNNRCSRNIFQDIAPGDRPRRSAPATMVHRATVTRDRSTNDATRRRRNRLDPADLRHRCPSIARRPGAAASRAGRLAQQSRYSWAWLVFVTIEVDQPRRRGFRQVMWPHRGHRLWSHPGFSVLPPTLGFIACGRVARDFQGFGGSVPAGVSQWPVDRASVSAAPSWLNLVHTVWWVDRGEGLVEVLG